MKTKINSSVLAILMSLAMAFAMMPVMGQTAFADDQAPAGGNGIYVPLTVSSGFNVDAIYEEDGTYDEGIDSEKNTFFAVPFVKGSLPEGGLLDLDDRKYFKLGDYTANNVLKLDKNRQEGTLKLAAGEKCRSLIVLMTGAHYGGTVNGTVKFSDSSSYKVEDMDVPDWSVSDGVKPAYRCGRYEYEDDEYSGRPDGFGLYEYKFELPEEHQNKEVTEILFDDPDFDGDGSTICIFGVSAIRNTAGKTVMLDSNGGKCGTTFFAGDAVTTIRLPEPTKTEMVFLGWSDGVNTYDADTDYSVSEDVVLTAKWRYDTSGLEEIDLFVQGVRVTKTNCNDVLSDDAENKGRVRYDFDTNTLTLNGADFRSVGISGDESGAVLYDQRKLGDFTIELIGENTIEDRTSSKDCNSICVKTENLIIKGTGSLTLEQNIPEGEIDSARAVYSSGNITIRSDIKITGISPAHSTGIHSDAKLTITDSTAEISVRSDNDWANGIAGDSDVEIEKAVITIAVNGYSNDSLGVSSENGGVLINGSALDVSAASSNGDAKGIFCGEDGFLIVSGGSNVRTAGKLGIDMWWQPLRVEAGSTFEAEGTSQALLHTDVGEETKALGAKVKTDLEGEYVPWDGSSELDNESYKAVYIPGKTVGHVDRVEPTCSKEGNIEYWYITDGDATTYYRSEITAPENKMDLKDTVIPADPNGHKYKAPAYTWSKDNKTVTAKAVCGNDASHILTETVTTTSKVTKKATAKAKGEVTYTARFNDPLFKTQTKKAATPKTFKTIKVNVKTVSANAVAKAIKKAGGAEKYITKVELGGKVRKISKKAFAKLKKAKTLVVKTKKLKKSTVKNSLKGSKIAKIKVKVGSKKANKQYIKKYKKIFTKKIAGKKVKIM